jgi:hypothetical protein
MEKEFVKYSEALALKDLGFDEPCLAFYNGKFLQSTDYDFDEGISRDIGLCCKTPTYSQVFRWFREKYNMLANVYSNASGFLYEYHDTIGGTHRYDSGFTGDCEDSGTFTSFEKAQLACLIKLIEILKEK